MTTTRLSNRVRTCMVNELRGLLTNTVRFVEIPVRSRAAWRDAWAAKFPEEYVRAWDTLRKYGVVGNYMTLTSKIRISTEIDRKVYVSLIETDELSGDNQGFFSITPGLASIVRCARCWEVSNDGRTPRSVVYNTIAMSVDYLQQIFGNDTDDLLAWMVNSAKLREDLIAASLTLTDLFGMIRTAGQLKRMVPEMVRYLSPQSRDAINDQKRSSTLPFEWAPYPKDNITRTMAALNTGHLLAGMGKPAQADHAVEYIDNYTWSRHAEWVV